MCIRRFGVPGERREEEECNGPARESGICGKLSAKSPQNETDVRLLVLSGKSPLYRAREFSASLSHSPDDKGRLFERRPVPGLGDRI